MSGDVTVLGTMNVSYWRLGARYRRAIGDRSALTVGMGVALGGWFDTRSRVTRFGSTTEHVGRISGGGLAAELYFDRQFSPRFRLRLGATLDSSVETTIVHPVALAVASF